MIKIPEGTPRPLGAPARGHRWNEEAVHEGFRSETGLTLNMFPWIIEEAVKEAVETPHPGNTLHTMQGYEIDNYWRLLERGQINLLFSYTSGEEQDYQQILFWLEGRNMITSISYKHESDEVNGYFVRRISDQERRFTEDDSISQVGWESAQAHKKLRDATPTRRVCYPFLGWVLGVGSPWINAPYTRHPCVGPCRALRFAGACVDPAMVQ
eukprot:4390538-Amphidinium_carterae.4